ncbi:unnamed protein product [Symbiodinium natans]|uniref:Uncharacterized protein n=1 Tax=Symbiodinium natans TaxID=878477 RepID=A0A812UUJ9_9DINO|nr:unnamed protein product [Symbiodinium natans]
MRKIEAWHGFLETMNSWLALQDKAYVNEIRLCISVKDEIRQDLLPPDTAARSAKLFEFGKVGALGEAASACEYPTPPISSDEAVRTLHLNYSIVSRMEAVYVRDGCATCRLQRTVEWTASFATIAASMVMWQRIVGFDSVMLVRKAASSKGESKSGKGTGGPKGQRSPTPKGTPRSPTPKGRPNSKGEKGEKGEKGKDKGKKKKNRARAMGEPESEAEASPTQTVMAMRFAQQG